MQDLEELKKEIEIQKTVSGNLFVTYFETIESVITRCENAEKEIDRSLWIVNSLIGERDMLAELVIELQQELKELREYKLVAEDLLERADAHFAELIDNSSQSNTDKAD